MHESKNTEFFNRLQSWKYTATKPMGFDIRKQFPISPEEQLRIYLSKVELLEVETTKEKGSTVETKRKESTVVTKEPSLIKTIIELLKTGVDIIKLGLSLSKDCLELTIFVGRLAIDEISNAVKSIKSLEQGDIEEFSGLILDIVNGEKAGSNDVKFDRKSLNINSMLANLADAIA